MIATGLNAEVGFRNVSQQTFTVPARQTPAGIRHNRPESMYPQFIPWREITCIGVYEEEDAPYYLVAVQRVSYGGTVDLLRTQNLSDAETFFESIMRQISEGAAIIEVS